MRFETRTLTRLLVGDLDVYVATSMRTREDFRTIDVERSGIEPFLEAVTTSILSEDVAALVSSDDPLHAWPIALAWLARRSVVNYLLDQECRFDKPLDWRSPDSDSGSPARNLSSPQRLGALRALIGAIVPEEYRLRTEIRLRSGAQHHLGSRSRRIAAEPDRPGGHPKEEGSGPTAGAIDLGTRTKAG